MKTHHQLFAMLGEAAVRLQRVNTLAGDAIKASPEERQAMSPAVNAAAAECQKAYTELWSALGLFDPTPEEVRQRVMQATADLINSAPEWLKTEMDK